MRVTGSPAGAAFTAPGTPPTAVVEQSAVAAGESALGSPVSRWPAWARAALREPLLHFLLLGLTLWATQRALAPTPRIESYRAAAGTPALAMPSRPPSVRPRAAIPPSPRP